MTISAGTTGRVLVVIAASVVLAFGVSGLERAASAMTSSAGPSSLLRAAGLGVAIIALVAFLVYRRRRSAGRNAADPVTSTLVATVVLLAMFAMISVLPLAMGPGEPSTPGTPPPEPPADESDRSAVDPPMELFDGRVVANPRDRPMAESAAARAVADQTTGEGSGAGFTIFQFGILLLALVVIAIVAVEAIRRVLFLLRRARHHALPVRPDEPHAAEEVEEAMMRAAVELTALGLDPSNQITGAYYRLLSVLGQAGYSRRPQEAPHEHLHRVLIRLGVSPAPMRRLTELYVFAEFGRGEVGAEHRRDASEALERSLESLRKRYPGLDSDAGAGSAWTVAR